MNLLTLDKETIYRIYLKTDLRGTLNGMLRRCWGREPDHDIGYH